MMEPITDIAATRAKMAAWEERAGGGRLAGTGRGADRSARRLRRSIDRELPHDGDDATRRACSGAGAGADQVFTSLREGRARRTGRAARAAARCDWTKPRSSCGCTTSPTVSSAGWTRCAWSRRRTAASSTTCSSSRRSGRCWSTWTSTRSSRIDAPLRWVCKDEPEEDPDDDSGESTATDRPSLELTMADDELVPYGLRLLPGGRNLYLTDEAVFDGPPKWTEGTQVEPRYEIPRSVLETVAGVEFLGRIKASLPGVAGRSGAGRVDGGDDQARAVDARLPRPRASTC